MVRYVIVARGLVIRLDGRAVLGGLDLDVPAGRSVAVTGVSGAGKSTLLAVLAGLRRPDEGSVLVDGADVWRLSSRQRAALRLRSVGMVFQSAELLPELTLAENVELVLRLHGGRMDRSAVAAESLECLVAVGVDHLADRLPQQVSGGERQRAAVARALARRPRVILADEPTGALNPALARETAELLCAAAIRHDAALVVVTHNPEVAAVVDERWELAEGRLRLCDSASPLA